MLEFFINQVWSDGSVYEGYWHKNKQDGLGRYVSTYGNPQFYKEDFYRKGHYYEGEYKNDMKNGHGVETLSNGTSYTGGWKNNLMHG